MRTAKIEINKKEYLLCFSARVMRDCSERYGNAENIGKALTEGTEVQKMDESFWLLSAMMDAGAKYAKVEGISTCLLYTSPSPRDGLLSRMPSSA